MTDGADYSRSSRYLKSIGGIGVESLTAVVLAGGLGTRLSPVIGDEPKALAPLGGRPFLAYLLDRLEAAGVRKVALCVGHRGESVSRRLGPRWGSLEISYSQESHPLGTGGALRLALPLVESDPLLAMNGDSWCDFDVFSLLAWHRAHRAEGSILLARGEDARRFGKVTVGEQGAVLSFEEKGDSSSSVWINAGVYLFSRRLADSIPADRPVSLEKEMFPLWTSNALYGYRGRGHLVDIGTPDSYAEARILLAGEPQVTMAHAHSSIASRRYVVLDRDGTLNAECGYLSEPGEVELLPGVVEGLRRLRALDLGLVVITNQSAVGRRYIDTERLDAIHRRLRALLAESGVDVDAIYSCVHRPQDNCACRKPAPELVTRAARDLAFDPSQAFFVGDKASDIQLGKHFSAYTLLVTTGCGAEALAKYSVAADYAVDNLTDAARVIEHLLGI